MMPRPSRRTLLAASLAAPALARVDTSVPDRPIHYVRPFPPGATNDNVSRTMARALQARLGVAVVVDNRAAGAGGAVGARFIAEARPDGLTLLNASAGNLTIAPHPGTVGYDPLRAFAAVACAGDAYSLVAVHPSLPARPLPGSPAATPTSTPSGARRWNRPPTRSPVCVRAPGRRGGIRRRSALASRYARSSATPKRPPRTAHARSSTGLPRCAAPASAAATRSPNASAASGCWRRRPAARCATRGGGPKWPPRSARRRRPSPRNSVIPSAILFTPVALGALALRNRVVMAPMTRSCASDGHIPPLAARYYAQRAGAGLIVTEATWVTPQGVGCTDYPPVAVPAP